MTTYDPTRDPQEYFSSSPISLGRDAAAITPSDTIDLDSYPKAIVVTAAGNLVVLPLLAADDGAHLITFTDVPAGLVLPFTVRRVMATGTTASVAGVIG